MPLEKPTFYDNTCVFFGKDFREFLSFSFAPIDEIKHYNVCLSRYYVPGRGDTYSFSWLMLNAYPPALSYYSEGRIPLSKAIKMAQKDFDKPQVVELAVNAFNAERIVLHYSHNFLMLLGAIAPKSKTYRAIKKLCEKTMEERKVRIENEKVMPQTNLT